MQKKTEIISAFPGTGKTIFFDKSNLFVLDSDSSFFDKTNFPQNYIDYIKKYIGKVDYILVSSHKEVRKALANNGIEFTLVYPAMDLKEEYLERYKNRGNNEEFIKLLSDNWTEWISGCKGQGFCKGIELQKGEYLINLIKE